MLLLEVRQQVLACCLLQATLNTQALLQGMTLADHQAIHATQLALVVSALAVIVSRQDRS
jgi:hypothetical protein